MEFGNFLPREDSTTGRVGFDTDLDMDPNGEIPLVALLRLFVDVLGLSLRL
jgi:hypothetical protein